MHEMVTVCRIKPKSQRIVRFLDRTIGCDWAKVRPIGKVCYDLQQRSVAYRDRSLRVEGRGRCDGLVLKIVSPRKFVQNSLNLPFC